MPYKIRSLWFFILLLFLIGWGQTSAAASSQPPFPNQIQAVSAAAHWLVTTHQNSDGGYSSFSTGANIAPSDISGTLDAILALGSAGYDVRLPYPGHTASPVDFLAANRDALLTYAQQDGSSAGKLILGLLATHQDPRTFAGHDFVALLEEQLDSQGSYNSSTPYQQALAILGLSGAKVTIPDTALLWLADRQSQENGLAGSWDDGFGTNGNSDATALSIMALIAGGMPSDDPIIEDALAFLAATQTESGGWEYGPGFGANANSTGLVIQALHAAGLRFTDPAGAWRPADISPLDYLLNSQSGSGAFTIDFGSGPVDDFYATVQALPALAGQSWPLKSHRLAVQMAVSCLQTLQDPATGGWESFAGFGVDAGGTSRAIQALAAAGENPTDYVVNGINAVQALENLTPDYVAAGRGGRVGTIMQGVAAAGGNVTDFAGLDLYLTLTSHISPTGELDDTSFGVFSHSRALLGAIAAGYGDEAALEPAIGFLLAAAVDYDWGGADSNGIALQVLGPLNLAQPEMLKPIRASQLADGGWGYDVTSPSSTAEVVRGLIAVGENPFTPAWSVIMDGRLVNPAQAVLAAQGENGCWPNLYGPGDDPFATTDGILLLTSQPRVWDAAAPTAIEPISAEATPLPTATAETIAETAPTTVPEAAAPTTITTTEPAPGRPTPTLVSDDVAAEAGSGRSRTWIIVLVVFLAAGGVGAYLAYNRK